MSTAPTTRREARAQLTRSAPPHRRLGAVAGEIVLWIAAVGGALCLVLVILAFAANITLIMFSTGSMSPTIPAGSVAVVQQIPASAIAVGDVVTVDRDGQLPVTHRVMTIEPGANEAERVITMRGDANERDDAFPYTVESVRVVLFSVPAIAPVIAAFSNPIVLGTVTVAAALLVGWAFWPRDSQDIDAPDAGKTATRGGGAS